MTAITVMICIGCFVVGLVIGAFSVVMILREIERAESPGSLPT